MVMEVGPAMSGGVSSAAKWDLSAVDRAALVIFNPVRHRRLARWRSH